MHVRTAPGRPRSDHAYAPSALQHNHYATLTHTNTHTHTHVHCPHERTSSVYIQWAFAHVLAQSERERERPANANTIGSRPRFHIRTCIISRINRAALNLTRAAVKCANI